MKTTVSACSLLVAALAGAVMSLPVAPPVSNPPRVVSADIVLAGLLGTFPLPESEIPPPAPTPERSKVQTPITVKGIVTPKIKIALTPPRVRAQDSGDPCPPGCEPWPEPEPS